MHLTSKSRKANIIFVYIIFDWAKSILETQGATLSASVN